MKKIFLIIVVSLCFIIVFYLRQSRASETLEGLKIKAPTLSDHIASVASKKISTLFSLVPGSIKSSAIWGALGRGFYALKPQLETTQWAGEQIQKIGRFSLITAGVAATASSSMLLLTFFTQIKKNRAIHQEIEKIKKEIRAIENQNGEYASSAVPENTEEINKKITEKQAMLNALIKKSSLFQRLIKKITLPAILTLGSFSLAGQAYGVGYAGDWLHHIGKTLNSWSIPIK